MTDIKKLKGKRLFSPTMNKHGSLVEVDDQDAKFVLEETGEEFFMSTCQMQRMLLKALWHEDATQLVQTNVLDCAHKTDVTRPDVPCMLRR